MDPVTTYLGRLLLEEITPVVMVLTTPLVEDACRKNGLSFVEMLLPFSLFNKIDVHVRTASDQAYRLQMFKLRLVYSSVIRKQDYEAAEEHLKQVVRDSNEKALPDLLSEPPELEIVLGKSESDLCPQWVRTFNRELIRTLSFSDHETFDHPVACLLVVSSKDKQPINRFVDLFNTDQFPSLLNDGVMDPKILRHYLLLHDNQEGTPESASSILGEMRSTFGSSNCKLLCINSARGADGNMKDMPWLPYKTDGVDSEIGCCLNVDDMNEIRDFMQDFASNHIIPYMEQKIRVLNQQVSATRKGFRNQIKNLWWRKGKEDMPEAPNGPSYTFSSIETQVRILGDYAFMLRDYELALSNYRLLSTDYKLDKAWKHYAGVQEMSGLSYFMLDQSRKESEYCMENAFSTYLKIGSSGQRNATRCGLWWAEMLKARGQHREASSVYFRISNEEPALYAAVMLEQASCCYLLSPPPMLRKYGFHLILAGDRYYISDQKQHAIRAYRNALFVYKENAWSYINDHVHINVARWYGSLGIFDVAIKNMLEVIACSHQSSTTQKNFLDNLFHFVQRTGKKYDVYKLGLPVINMSSLKVAYEDHRTYSSNADVDVNERIWQDLEEELIPSASAVRTNWLDSQSKSSPLSKYNDSCICVAGEAVKVILELKNPLEVSIFVSGLSLMFELSESSQQSNFDTSSSHIAESEDRTLLVSSANRYQDGENASFVLSELDVVLGGGETKRVQLEVTPKVQGILKLVGIRWALSGSVIGYQFFELDAKKKSKKGKKGARHSLSSSLVLLVIEGIPKVEGCVDGLPSKVFAGNLRLLTLKLTNHSEYSVKNLKMKVSNSRILIPGSSADLDLDFPQCMEKRTHVESKDLPENTETSKPFTFPEDATIEGEKTLSWPLWFHSGISGNISLYISLYYEVEKCSSDLAYRTLRMHYNLEAVPSLDVSFRISPSPSSLQEYLVRMNILNRTSSEFFLLHQLSCVGNQWVISTLPLCSSICCAQSLSAGQEMSCFFKLKDLSRSSSKMAGDTLHGSDILMDSEGSKDTIDVSRSPLADFHYQERCHQRQLLKERRSLIDFILISKVRGNNSEPGASFQLLSNHACHSSVVSKSPIRWFMEGPRTIGHDFSTSYCESVLHVSVYNFSGSLVSVRLAMLNGMPETSPPGEGAGWYDLSLSNDPKILSNVDGNRSASKPPYESAPPFVWCASSSTRLDVQPACAARAPLRICVFAPGTYNLSNYEVQWKMERSDEVERSSGIGRGHPFHLTVLHVPPVSTETP